MLNFRQGVLSVLVAATVAACGGGGGDSSGGNPNNPSPGGGGSTVAESISITSNGAIDKPDIRIEIGQSVRFTNNDARMHEIQSNPHMAHTDCPPVNAFGRQNPGGSVVLGPFTQRGTCGYHDHMDFQNRSLQGQIRVGVDEAGPAPNYIRP
jgi:plastocyanin